MKNRAFEKAFSDLKLSGDVRERILDAALESDDKVKVRRSARPLRLAAVAAAVTAAVCLMAGTALAVAYVSGRFDTVEVIGGGEYANGYRLSGGENQLLPLDVLSDGVMAMSEERPEGEAVREFQGENWKAAQEFSGVVLPENSAIDALPVGGSALKVDSRGEGPARLTFIQWTDGLEMSFGEYSSQSMGAGTTVTAELYTELAEKVPTQDRYYAFYDCTVEEYTSVNGVNAVITRLTPNEPEREEKLLADINMGSCLFHIESSVTSSSEEALKELYRLVDGFAG